MQKKKKGKQTGTSSNILARQSIGGAPLFITSQRLVSTDRDLLTNLAQSCKPAAVGMYTYSSSVNICFYRKGPYNPEDNFKHFWPTTNMHVQQTTIDVCKKSAPTERGGRKILWSTFSHGVIMTFQQQKQINKCSTEH